MDIEMQSAIFHQNTNIVDIDKTENVLSAKIIRDRFMLHLKIV